MIDWSMKEPEKGKKGGTRRGDLLFWCDRCASFVKTEEFTGTCPQCGTPMYHMRCVRCGEYWYTIKPGRAPGTCPKCKSPYYNRAYTRRGPKPRGASTPAPAPTQAPAPAPAEPEQAPAQAEAVQTTVQEAGL